MSANKRRQGHSAGGIFGNVEGGLPSLEQTDSDIYGNDVFEQFARIDQGKITAKPVSIFEIFPDPMQPRRAVPSPVRPYWNGKPTAMNDLFSNWLHLAEQERGSEWDIEPYLMGEGETERSDEEVGQKGKLGPIQASFLEIIELAANIRKHDLTNPITVARTPNGYRLETGERRWLAFHILHISFENEQHRWEKIPARVMEETSVWRQASENNARANLNAISRARQLAILVMEIYRQRGVQFRGFEESVGTDGIDRPYYAQVADGNRFTAKGHGEAMMNALGFKQSSQFREHRDLLKLPDEVWRIADDLSWTQGRIRELKRNSADDEQFVQKARTAARSEGYTVGIPTVEPPTLPAKVVALPDNPLLFGENKRRFARLWRLAAKVGEGRGEVAPGDLYEIQQMRRWLDDLEQVARTQVKK